MYDVELIAGISAPVDIPGYLYRSASEYYLTDTFTRISTAEKVTWAHYLITSH
jgi:hypothetical protein